VVSAVGGAEVRQLESEGRSTAEERRHPQVGDRDGPGEPRLGIYENPRRPSDRIGRSRSDETTVANILLEEGIEPAPEREKKRR